MYTLHLRRAEHLLIEGIADGYIFERSITGILYQIVGQFPSDTLSTIHLSVGAEGNKCRCFSISRVFR